MTEKIFRRLGYTDKNFISYFTRIVAFLVRAPIGEGFFFSQGLLCARHYTRSFTCDFCFNLNPHNNPTDFFIIIILKEAKLIACPWSQSQERLVPCCESRSSQLFSTALSQSTILSLKHTHTGEISKINNIWISPLHTSLFNTLLSLNQEKNKNKKNRELWDSTPVFFFFCNFSRMSSLELKKH